MPNSFNVGDIDLSLVLTSKDFETQLNNVVKKTVDDIQKDVNKGTDKTVKNVTTKIEHSFQPLNNEFKNSVKSVAKDLNNSISDTFSNMVNRVTNDFSDMTNSATDSIQTMCDEMSDGFKEASNNAESSLDGLGGKFKKIAGIIGGAIAFDQILDMAEIGSDLAEVSNVVETVFTSMSDQVKTFSKDAMTQFGMSETMTMKYVGTLGSMARAFNFTEKEAYDMATTLSGLAGDVASFYNIDQEEAFTKLKSVFTGETESLKELGIVMTETALKEFALSQGIQTSIRDMSEQEKTALRYKFVLEKLSFAQGDFAKTSEGWANQMRIFTLQWESLKGTLGQGFIIVLTPVLQLLNMIISRITDVAKTWVEALRVMSSAWSGFSFFGGGSNSSTQPKKPSKNAIPKLASGGYVKKNNPQLALIGDNTSEGEIVAPESKITEAVKKGVSGVASKVSSSGRGTTSNDELNKLVKDSETLNKNASKLSGTVKKIGNNVKKTVKDVKKSIMGFDELNILQKEEQNPLDDLKNSIPKIKDALKSPLKDLDKLKNSLGSLGKVKGLDTSLKGLNAGLENSAQNTKELNDKLSQTNGEIDKLNTKAGRLKELFKQGFNLGLGTPNFDKITDHAKSTMFSLRTIFTDPKLAKAMDNYMNSLVFNTGQILGGLASIGLTAVEMLIGGIDLYLAKNRGFITDFFIAEYNALADIMDIIGDTVRDIAKIFEVFRSDEMKSIMAGFIEIFANAFFGVTELATKLSRDLLNLVTQPIRDNVKEIQDLLLNLMKFIEPIVQGVADFVTNAMKKINKTYDEHLKPLIDAVTDFVSNTLKTILNLINEYLMPMLEYAGKQFKNIFDKYLSPIFGQLMDIVGQLADILSLLIEYGFKPLAEIILNSLAPALLVGLGGALVMVGEVLKIILKLFSDFLKIVQGVLDFIIGVFTNDWEKAWNGLGTVVQGVFDFIDDLTGGLISTLQADAHMIGNVFKGIWKDIQQSWKNAGNWAKGIGQDIYNGFTKDCKKTKQDFKIIWTGIQGIFGNAGSWFGNTFMNARNSIVNAFKGLPNWFNGIWNGIKGSFNVVGSKIGNMIGGAIKSIVNYVLRLCESKINSFISIFNAVIKFVNKLPNVNIGTMKSVSLPKLAEGGYVKANTPQLAIIGDNKREGEIVAPESKITEAVTRGVTVALEKVIQLLNNNPNNNGGGDIVIPVSIGQEHIDTIIVNSQKRQTLRSGGRV